MRGLVLPISSPSRPKIIYALALFILFISVACAPEACAQQLIPKAVVVQPQSATASSSKEKQRQKQGLVPVRQEEAPEGSRVTITYNSPLSDYSAYRRGDRFVVIIPKADVPRLRGNLRGRGFDGVQVERRGEDAVISFRLQRGAKARVDQQFNRLDVFFSAPLQVTNAASNQRQTADAPLQPSASKASQTASTPKGTPPTPLANHNLAAVTTAQPETVKPSGETAPGAAATAAQPDVTSQTPTDSPAPATGSPAAASSEDKTAAAQPARAVSPQVASTSSSISAPRYWLPPLMALLLIVSAWATIASRRRAERRGSTTGVEPAPKEESAEAETLPSALAGETGAPGLENSEGLAPSDEEALELETVGAATPRSDSGAATLGEVGRPLFNENLPPADKEHSHIPSTILRCLGSEDANERSAGVLKLAEVGSDEAFGRIGSAFDDPVQRVRDAAARSLFNISADRVASFKRLMREASPERRRRVGEAIVSSGMASEAINDLSSQSGERAYDALLVLSLVAKSGEVQSLVETIEAHPSTEVRLALVKLLALSGRQEIVQTFRYLATRDSLPIAVRSSIMEAIHQLNNPQPLDLSAT